MCSKYFIELYENDDYTDTTYLKYRKKTKFLI